MKTNIIGLLLIAFILGSCKEELPVQLTYNDIYGYDYSATTASSNGAFFVKTGTNLTFTEANKTDSTATYAITTTGTDPYFITTRIGGKMDVNACVLSFQYKTDKVITPIINLDAKAVTTSTGTMATMDVSTDWKDFSWDLGMAQGLIATNSWGVLGSYFKLLLKQANVNPAHIQIQNIRFRKRTVAEETVANTGLWLTLSATDGGSFSNFLDITSQEGGFNLIRHSAFSFKLTNNTNFLRTTTLSRSFLTGEQNHLKFEYKSDIQTNLVLFVNLSDPLPKGGAVILLPASSSWNTIDYDLTDTFKDIPQSVFSANPLQLSFYYPGTETPSMSIRGMHFYVK